MKSVLFKLRMGLGLIVALVSVFSVALPVWAHGVIVQADPPVGGALAAAPAQVRLWFSEPVDPAFSHIAVYPAGASGRVDANDLHLDAEGALTVSLRTGLPDGIYTVAWQVFTPGDGHESNGAYSFGVGVAAGGTTDSATTERTPLGDLVRFLTLAGECLFLGAAVFRWAIRLEDEAHLQPGLFWLAQAVRVALGLSILGALYLQTVALDVPVWEVLTSQWGMAWVVRALMTGIVVARAPVMLQGGTAGGQTNSALLAGTFLLLTTSLTSHSAARFGWLGVGVDAVHLASAAIWSGGVLCAALAVWHGERGFLPRFGVLAAAAVGGLAATGLWLANGEVGSWSALLLTEYGRTLLLKMGVVAVAFGLGAINALVDPARWPMRWQGLLRRLPVLEAAAGLGVILSAAILTNLPPGYAQLSDNAPRKVSASKSLDDLTASVSLSPARLGADTVEVHLSDASGQPVVGRTLRLQFVPVSFPSSGALVSDLPLAEVGQGLYSASGTNFTSPGSWQALLVVDEVRFLSFDFAIGPDAVVRTPDQPLGPAGQIVGWLDRYAVVAGLGLLLLAAAGWSAVAWRTLQTTATPAVRLAMWLAPGLLLAGAVWLWIKLLS